MHLIRATTALLSLAATSLAALATVDNASGVTIYLTVTNSSQISVEHTIDAGTNYTQPLTGMGNAYGITLAPDYFSLETKKFVLGFTDSSAQNLTYWSVSNVDGNPFDGSTAGVTSFLVDTSFPSCSNTTSYDGAVHVCSDAADLILHVY